MIPCTSTAFGKCRDGLIGAGQYALQRLMEVEAEQHVGAGRDERSEERAPTATAAGIEDSNRGK